MAAGQRCRLGVFDASASLAEARTTTLRGEAGRAALPL